MMAPQQNGDRCIRNDGACVALSINFQSSRDVLCCVQEHGCVVFESWFVYSHCIKTFLWHTQLTHSYDQHAMHDASAEQHTAQ